jgi:uncharacterized membrane protein YuzA (DUF378 family)
MKKLHMITFILLVIGGLNWLLEAFGFGIGNYISSNVAMIIYILIGLSAIVELVNHKKCCTMCSAGKGMSKSGGAPIGGGDQHQG